MTHQEATRILIERFPGKQLYVGCTVWTYANGTTKEPEFTACVYNAMGEDANATGSGHSLQVAVDRALSFGNPVPQEAEEMFATSSSL